MNENKYQKQLDEIRQRLVEFYNQSFINAEQEYIQNRQNKFQLKELLIDVTDDSSLSPSTKQKLINGILWVLAKNTGSAEDSAISEEILDNLFYDLRILNQQNIDYYYQIVSSGRWD